MTTPGPSEFSHGAGLLPDGTIPGTELAYEQASLRLQYQDLHATLDDAHRARQSPEAGTFVLGENE